MGNYLGVTVRGVSQVETKAGHNCAWVRFGHGEYGVDEVLFFFDDTSQAVRLLHKALDSALEVERGGSDEV